MDEFIAFTTYLERHPEFNKAEKDRALAQHLQQQKFISDFLDGRLPADVVLDCLAENGRDPVQYIDQVGLNLGLLNQSGKWLLDG